MSNPVLFNESGIDSDPEPNMTTEPITETFSIKYSESELVDSIDGLYQTIKSIHDANEETITKIDESADVLVNHFKYNAPPEISEDGSSCTFKLEVTPVTDPAKTLVSKWRTELVLINVFDIFNLKIAYEGSTYDDLKRLNKEMFEGVERYNMFYDDDSKKGRVELKKFVQNFRIIQKHINDVHSLCEDQSNKAKEIEAILSDANMKMTVAMGIGCRYVPPTPRWISKAIPMLTAKMEHDLFKWLACKSDSIWTPKHIASKDGFGAATFHSKCDGVARLLVVIQSDKDYVFGGYTGGASFHSSTGYMTSTGQQPFLFSLLNPSGTPPMKFDLTKPTHALNGHPSYSATFGGGHDIHIVNNANVTVGSYVSVGNSYAAPQRGAHITDDRDGWTVKEILAFQIPQ